MPSLLQTRGRKRHRSQGLGERQGQLDFIELKSSIFFYSGGKGAAVIGFPQTESHGRKNRETLRGKLSFSSSCRAAESFGSS